MTSTISQTIDLRPAHDPEMELLVHCARATIDPERAARLTALVTGGIDWTRLWNLSQRNGLSPLLYFHLNQICPSSVPADRLEFLRDYFQKNSAFSVLLTGELARVLKSFNEQGINAIPYKGPALALKLYGNLALRQFSDLDILVRKSDVWKASELIEARGFEPHFAIPEKKRAAFVRLSYVQLFRRDAGRTVIELHWGIAPRFFGVPLDADALQRLEPMTLQGATVFQPSATDMLLMLCVHGAKDCWERLEWVAGIAQLLRANNQIDWERVGQLSLALHCRRILVFGLLLAHGLFDSSLPPQVGPAEISPGLLELAKEVTQRFQSAAAPSQSFSQRVAFHLRLKDSFADKVRHCSRLASTTTPVDWSTMTLPGPLSFAYPLLRAIRLTRKYGLNNQQARS
jgi:Uncharacterised nucleotidyltransferase